MKGKKDISSNQKITWSKPVTKCYLDSVHMQINFTFLTRLFLIYKKKSKNHKHLIFIYILNLIKNKSFY